MGRDVATTLGAHCCGMRADAPVALLVQPPTCQCHNKTCRCGWTCWYMTGPPSLLKRVPIKTTKSALAVACATAPGG
eukprot:11167441-Lingulodinium_polyedra.AAC.1